MTAGLQVRASRPAPTLHRSSQYGAGAELSSSKTTRVSWLTQARSRCRMQPHCMARYIMPDPMNGFPEAWYTRSTPAPADARAFPCRGTPIVGPRRASRPGFASRIARVSFPDRPPCSIAQRFDTSRQRQNSACLPGSGRDFACNRTAPRAPITALTPVKSGRRARPPKVGIDRRNFYGMLHTSATT